MADNTIPTMMIVLIVASMSLVLGVWIYSQIYEVVDNDAYVNETHNFGIGAGSTAISVDHTPVIAGSYTVYNCSTAAYQGGTCVIMNASNYTINTVTGVITELTDLGQYTSVNYTSGRLTTSGVSTASTLNTTTYSAFELFVVALVVIAAVTVLGYIFLIGNKK